LAGHLQNVMAVYYRRRVQNTAKKAGNIAIGWSGSAAPTTALSCSMPTCVMTAQTLVRLALGMQSRPCAGLIQTVPRLVGGSTIFQRLQQFAAGIYGPRWPLGLPPGRAARQLLGT